MENIKEIIAKNLVELRKSHKLTQQALAEKLNYTDKAISRWEHAETLPDIETLCRVCDIYGVKFEYLLQKEQPKNPAKNPNIKRENIGSKIITTLIAVSTVWLLVTVLYAVQWQNEPWNLFIWAMPATALVLFVANYVFFNSKIFRIISSSFFVWLMLLSIYIELLIRNSDNIWSIFIIGFPLQAIIILLGTIKISHKDKENKYNG